MRLAFDQRVGLLGVLHHFARGSDDFFVGGVVVGLTDIDVNELKAGVDPGLGGLYRRAVVKVDVNLDAVFALVVVDHVAHIVQAERLHLAVAHLHQHRRVLGLGGTTDRDQRFLVVDIKRADGKTLLAAAAHQIPRTLTVMPDLFFGYTHASPLITFS